MTRWESDTCNCVIEFNDLTLKITRIVKKCNTHNPIINTNFINCPSQKYNSDIEKDRIIRNIKPEDFLIEKRGKFLE